jgi:hypothetical protein
MDSSSLPIPKPARPADQDYLDQLHGVDSEDLHQAFKSTAQVTSIVSGIRRAVCVPLSLAARAVEPYPEAAELLYMVRQAVKDGSLSTRDAAAQLVALLQDRERPRVSSGRAPPGFGEASFRNMTPSPHYAHAMEPSTGSSASSSPYSHQQQAANAYPVPTPSLAYAASHQQSYSPAAHQQSVWNDASGLPGVTFSTPATSSVPQHVQALWHEPAGQEGKQPAYSMAGPAASVPSWDGYAVHGSSYAQEPASTASRYAPPGMPAVNRPAYTPLSLVNRM